MLSKRCRSSWATIDIGEKTRRLYVCVRSNLFNLWFAGKTLKATITNLIVQLPFLILAVIGTVLAVRDNRLKIVAPLALLILYYVAVYVPILAQARYSVPLIPFLSILASLTLVAAYRRLTGEDERRRYHEARATALPSPLSGSAR